MLGTAMSIRAFRSVLAVISGDSPVPAYACSLVCPSHPPYCEKSPGRMLIGPTPQSIRSNLKTTDRTPSLKQVIITFSSLVHPFMIEPP